VKPRYTYAVDNVVLERFSEAKKRHREELLRIFAGLADDPSMRGDWVQKDSAGRDCQVKRFGAWSVTYWPEHLGSVIHIIDIERLW
jgi:hypothetical protein